MPAHFQTYTKTAPSMNIDTSSRPRFSLTRIRLALLCGLSLPVSLALAQTSGTWTSTTGGNWTNTGNWSGGTVATGGSTGSTATATFTTGAQTVNLDADQTLSGITAGSAAGLIISSSNGSVLTLAGSSTPTINGTLSISATIAGTQGFSFNPGGTRYLYLSGNNTYTGVTTLSNGQIYVQSANALGATGAGNGTLISRTSSGSYPQLHFANTITTSEDFTLSVGYSSATGGGLAGDNPMFNVDSGATTVIDGSLTLVRATSSVNGTNNINVFQIGNSGNLTINGGITGSTTGAQATGNYVDPNRLTIGNATGSVTTINGIISDGTLGTGGLALYNNGTGRTTLTAINTYTGGTVVNAGTLAITGTGSIASTQYTIAAGAKFDVSGLTVPGYSLANVATTLGVGATSNGFIDVGAGVLTLGNALTLNFAALPTASTFNLYDSAGVLGEFTSVTLTGALVGTLTRDNGVWSGDIGGYSISLAESSGTLTVGSAIPEPSAAGALAGLAAVGFAALRRRRR